MRNPKCHTTGSTTTKLLDPAAGSDDEDGEVKNIDVDMFVQQRWETRLRRPTMFLVHGALILVQVIFGVGSVVGKVGVSTFNPVLFALIREACAGPLLLVRAFVRACVCSLFLVLFREFVNMFVKFFLVGCTNAQKIPMPCSSCRDVTSTLYI